MFPFLTSLTQTPLHPKAVIKVAYAKKVANETVINVKQALAMLNDIKSKLG